MIKLKPCPFCGDKKIEIIWYSLHKSCSVLCTRCKADIAPCKTEEEAAEAWNKRASGWISVKDRLPGKQTVLVYAESDDEDSPVWCTGYYKPNGRWKGWFLSGKIDSDIFKHVEESDDFKVTHWMPLPEPPEVNEE